MAKYVQNFIQFKAEYDGVELNINQNTVDE